MKSLEYAYRFKPNGAAQGTLNNEDFDRIVARYLQTSLLGKDWVAFKARPCPAALPGHG